MTFHSCIAEWGMIFELVVFMFFIFHLTYYYDAYQYHFFGPLEKFPVRCKNFCPI